MSNQTPTASRSCSLDDLTPFEAAAALRHLPGLVFFDSALESSQNARVSIVSAEPALVLKGNLAANAARLQEEVAKRQRPGRADAAHLDGFAAGWIGYDGDFTFGFYDSALFFDHATGRWSEVGRLSDQLMEPVSQTPASSVHFVPALDSSRFCAMVARAQEYIGAGDIYQVNLSHPFTAPWSGDPLRFYEALRHYSPAPYAAYLELAGRTVLSSSPESFLHLSGSVIRTRPIKGTRPRHSDRHADEKSAYDLLTSPKEIAELVMITDLERNDLGKVCDWGSVTVRELLALERYEQVFHLVSTVEGRLRPDVDHVSALRECFPGGSITGAPKKRAMEIIAELEQHPRGLYTGAIGWFGFGGESQFNIAIRTVVIEGNQAHFHVGAGIVADSIPEREWQETLDKASGILLAAERLGSDLENG